MSPWPGKCLPHASTPCDCSAAMNASAALLTASAVVPNERGPMTGFAGLLWMSSTGAKSRFTPSEASSTAHGPAYGISLRGPSGRVSKPRDRRGRSTHSSALVVDPDQQAITSHRRADIGDQPR